MVQPGYGAMRSSTADRERAIDVLKAAFAEGRLDQAEYADRVGLVYSSRTYAELAALTADLPVGPLGTLAPGPAPPVPWPPPAHWQSAPWPHPAPWQPGSLPPVPWQAMPPATLPPPATRPTSGMALASLLFGLGSFVTLGIFAPLAIGLAIAAAAKIRRSGESGASMAVAGLLLGLLNLLAFHTIWT
jgi:hypothetical protein